MAETWVINESPSTVYFSFDASFVSNERTYVNLMLECDLHITGIVYNLPNLQGYDIAYENGNDGYYWTDEAYRTITFETSPTGNLLTWLEANGTLTPSTPSTADKLQDLIDIKQDIKTAIENKGSDLTGVDFSGYAEKIDSLPAVVEMTQAQYDALSVYDNNTYYLIVEEE